GGGEEVAVTEDADYRSITSVRSLDRPHVLAPGETIHGITRERIRLPPDIAGWLEGRSRYARLGLMIHVTSGFIAPGVDSRQVLEMSNVAGRPLVIHAGVPLCQVVLQRWEGEAGDARRFRVQGAVRARGARAPGKVPRARRGRARGGRDPRASPDGSEGRSPSLI